MCGNILDSISSLVSYGIKHYLNNSARHLLWNAKRASERYKAVIQGMSGFVLFEEVGIKRVWAFLAWDLLICFAILFQNIIQNAAFDKKHGVFMKPGENSGTWLKQYGLKMNVFVLDLNIANHKSELHPILCSKSSESSGRKKSIMYNWQLYSDQKKTGKDEAYHSEFFICSYSAMLQEAVDQFLHVVSLGFAQQYLHRQKYPFTLHCKGRKALSDRFQEHRVRINFRGESAILSKHFTTISRTDTSTKPTKLYFELQSYFASERAPEVILSSLCCRLCKCHLGPEKKLETH